VLPGDAPDLNAVADELITRLVAPVGTIDDDVTLLLVRTPARAAVVATTTLPAEPSMVATGRRFVADTLRGWDCSALRDTATLLASEVLTNSVRYGVGPLELRLRRGADQLVVEVADRDARLPELRIAEDTDEGGRGLFLVDAFASSWGARPLENGKAVWFSLPLGAAVAS
jgi:anti-sigma regulatory factor (Ser/Thr protein kinase)